MNRRLFITIHLYLSSFFAAAILLVAISGGLYLVGVKGEMAETTVASLPKAGRGPLEALSKAEVHGLLADAGVEGFTFEYVRQSGKRAYTRPTSREHYVIDATGPGVNIVRREPDLQARMIELHKGHGPTAFKTFQKVFAVGMVFIILSGLWLGLTAPRLVRNTTISFGAGLALFLVLVLF
jgi:hypothetical protein